jgi:hypothetical protein
MHGLHAGTVAADSESSGLPFMGDSRIDGPIEFLDVQRGDAHADFMAWKRENEDGFYLTAKSSRRVNLHRANCTHQGDYDLYRWARAR